MKVIHKFDYIVTAHHLDDQLETYLINSMRGTGLKGLLGIPEITSNLFRPLLQILKDEILVYAEVNKIDFREDSSNSKNDYYRNMIRNTIIPEFKKYDDNVMLKFKTTINNLISTKIFAETIIKKTKDNFFEIDNDKVKVKIDDLLKSFVKENKLEKGLDKVNVEAAWRDLMGNGVNAVFSGFENSYHIQLGRNAFKQYLYALSVALILAFLLIFTIVVLGYFQIYIVQKVLDVLGNQGYQVESQTVFWFDNMIARGVEFDIIGLSYYPQWHCTLDDLNANMLDIINRYQKDINVVEYSAFKREVHDLVFNLPENRGNGTCIWESLNTWSRIFDRQGNALDDITIYDEMKTQYLTD